MKLSNSYFFTLRENVKDEDSQSGNLLVRAGMVKKTSSGVYMLLPLGLKVFQKIETIIREEMNAINSLELSMPALIAEEVFINSGRREAFGNSMFTMKDRFNKPFVLGPTHEELFVSAAQMAIHSYKDLPISLYQFQTKFRDEPRPRFGLIRVREFVMKDAYTFDKDEAGMNASYDAMFKAYQRIFERLHLKTMVVRADTGVMGGLLSEEFQALSDIGEDIIVVQEESNYTSNIEVAACHPPLEISNEEPKTIEEVYTPNAQTIEEVSAYLKQPVTSFVKTLIYKVDDAFYALLLRGDHEVNETKVRKLLNASEVELASFYDVETLTKAPVGFAGPIGLEVPILMDQEVTALANFTVGANKADHHLINVNLKDFEVFKTADLRNIEEGDLCENGVGPVVFKRGIEVGNTFKLGDKYSKALDLEYLDENNTLHPVQMGSYGIGLGRCLAAIVQQNHSEKGILWPKNLSPVQVGIVLINAKDELQQQIGNQLYERFNKLGYDTVLDDRNQRPGVKFNDMELIGTTVRITLGRDLVDQQVEVKAIDQDEKVLVSLDDLTTWVETYFEN